MIFLVCIWNLVSVVGIPDVFTNMNLATPSEVVLTYKMKDVETDGDIYWLITAEDNINSGSTVRHMATSADSCGKTANQVDEDFHVEEIGCELTSGKTYYLYTALDYDGLGQDAFVASKIPFVVGTGMPTSWPSEVPTTPFPTFSPTEPDPTSFPTFPTSSPTLDPTYTAEPSSSPTLTPTNSSTYSPTFSPTNSPTSSPTNSPTEAPTAGPTVQPTTEGATVQPPTDGATTQPPTMGATVQPTEEGAIVQPPTEGATVQPPTMGPTVQPTTEEKSETRNMWRWGGGIIAAIGMLLLALVVSKFYCPRVPKLVEGESICPDTNEREYGKVVSPLH